MLRDTPRLITRSEPHHRALQESPKDIRTIALIASEHNRIPGSFDYDHPQTFYSLYPEIDQETYVTLGGTAKRKVD